MRKSRFEALVEHYRPFVRAFVARRVNASDVDTIVAEVFAIAWRRQSDVPEDALPWLYRTARNTIGTMYRSDARQAALRHRMESVRTEPAPDAGDAATNRVSLAEAFAELSEADCEILLLVAWEGLEMREVAEVLDISPGTANVRVHRARNRLRSLMNPEPEWETL